MMRGRLIHQRYDVYVEGTLLVKGRNSVVVDDRNTKTLSVRRPDEPNIDFTEVEVIEESKTNRESRFTYIGTAEGQEQTITAVRTGCGCGGR